MTLFSGMHRCHERASCWPDPNSKNGYFCKCHPGFKGNGNKQIHTMWTESNPEKMFENLAKNLTDELVRELDIKNSVDFLSITLHSVLGVYFCNYKISLLLRSINFVAKDPKLSVKGSLLTVLPQT